MSWKYMARLGGQLQTLVTGVEHRVPNTQLVRMRDGSTRAVKPFLPYRVGDSQVELGLLPLARAINGGEEVERLEGMSGEVEEEAR